MVAWIGSGTLGLESGVARVEGVGLGVESTVVEVGLGILLAALTAL